MKPIGFIATLALAVVTVVGAQGTQTANETLWEAARAGELARITAALNQGAQINAKARYDVTALFFAASNGRLDAVKLLVARGADVNAQDSFYRARAADMAATNGHTDVVIYLLQNGAIADDILSEGVRANQDALVKAAVAGRVTRQALQSAMSLAATLKRDALVPAIKAALDKVPPEPAAPPFTIDPATLPKYAGNYRDAASAFALAVTVQNGALMLQVQGQPAVTVDRQAAVEDRTRRRDFDVGDAGDHSPR